MSMGITKQFFSVYDCLVKSSTYLSLDDLSSATGLGRSSIHRHVTKLEKAGVVTVLKLYQFQYRTADGYEKKELAQQLEISRPFFL